MNTASHIGRLEISSSPPRKLTGIQAAREPGSWQLHSYFKRSENEDNFYLRYGILNYIRADVIQKVIIIPIGTDLSFRCLLEIANLFEFRIKKLCTFVAKELKEQADEFLKDFPDAECDAASDTTDSTTLTQYAGIVSDVCRALRQQDSFSYAKEDVGSIISPVLAAQGLMVMMEEDLLLMLRNKAAADGFVFVQPQAVNKKVVLELLLGSRMSCFLMSRSNSPNELVYDMLKLCVKANERAAANTNLSPRLPPSDSRLYLAENDISPIKKKVHAKMQMGFFKDISKSMDFQEPLKIDFPVFPCSVEKQTSSSGVIFKKDFGKLDSVPALIFLCIGLFIIIVAIYGLLTATLNSSGFLLFEVVALSSVLPAVLCFKFLFANNGIENEA